jgi:hypothetical protein
MSRYRLLPETKETLRGIGYDFLIDEIEKTCAPPVVGRRRTTHVAQPDAVTAATLMMRYVNMRLKEILDSVNDAEIVEGEYKVL